MNLAGEGTQVYLLMTLRYPTGLLKIDSNSIFKEESTQQIVELKLRSYPFVDSGASPQTDPREAGNPAPRLVCKCLIFNYLRNHHARLTTAPA